MKQTEEQAVERAIRDLKERNVFLHGSRVFQVRRLIPYAKHRPIPHEVWGRKEAYVLGLAPAGNVYLRRSDGSVCFWNRESDEVETLAPSVRAFVTALQPRVLDEGNQTSS